MLTRNYAVYQEVTKDLGLSQIATVGGVAVAVEGCGEWNKPCRLKPKRFAALGASYARLLLSSGVRIDLLQHLPHVCYV